MCEVTVRLKAFTNLTLLLLYFYCISSECQRARWGGLMALGNDHVSNADNTNKITDGAIDQK